MKYYSICIDGIDKTGKDTLLGFIDRLSNHKYIINVRGMLSQIAYSDLYKRDFNYDLSTQQHILNVLLTADKEDWEVRCKLTREPAINYEDNCEVFEEAYTALHRAGEKLFGIGNFAIIKTSGGYHTLVRKECLTFNPNNFLKEVYEAADNPQFSEYVDEFVANDSSHKSKDGNNIIKRSALIPTPGCRQYDSYPVVMNKEDFEL